MTAASPRQVISRRVAAIAANQWGVISRTQLVGCGLTPKVIRAWVDAGRLHSIYSGVYALGHSHLSAEGQLAAALFHAGPGSALSHATGISWWELLNDYRPDPLSPGHIHVSVPHRRRLDKRLICHHPQTVERVIHRRLPVTPVARTLRDFAARAPQRALRKAIAEADFRRLVHMEDLRETAARGAAGSAALKAAAAIHMPQLARTASPAEDEFLFLCERAELPLPEVNLRLGRHKVDACWPKQRLVVEIDSVKAHARPPRRLMDRERDLDLRRLGYEVRRYTWHQLIEAPEAVIADLRVSSKFWRKAPVAGRR